MATFTRICAKPRQSSPLPLLAAGTPTCSCFKQRFNGNGNGDTRAPTCLDLAPPDITSNAIRRERLPARQDIESDILPAQAHVANTVAMCQYRYHYYAGCQHQATVLMNFCDKAISLTATAQDRRKQNSPSGSRHHHQREGGAEDQSEGALSRLPALSPILSNPSASSPSIDPSSPASGSTVPTSLASFRELGPDTSSSTSQQQPFRRHTDTSVDDMAGLAPFSWKQLMPGTTSKATIAVHPTTAEVYHQTSSPSLDDEPYIPSRQRHEGTRQRTDESCHLVNGADALRHITNSYRGDFEVEQFATSHLHSRPPSSRSARGVKHVQSIFGGETFEALEAEVDSLKDELSRLREEKEQRQISGVDGWSTAPEKSVIRSPQTKIPAPAFQPKESAAMRLQEQHTKQQNLLDLRATNPHDTPASPPKASDFPELGSHIESEGGNESKMPHIDTTTQRRAELLKACRSKIYSTDDSAVLNSSPDNVEESWHVVGTPDSAHTNEERQTTLTKASPRFAQPTKAFARRADETLQRKDSVSRFDRSSPDGKATSPRTLTQRSPKRKAIPGAWITSPASANTDLDLMSFAKAPSPRCPHAGPSIETEKTNELAPMDFSMEPTLRKKVSSYMSPTKAATQRALATMGVESAKRFSPRLQKALPRINTCVNRPESPVVLDSATSGMVSPETVIQTEFNATSDAVLRIPSNASSIAQDHRRFSRRLTVGSSVGSPVVEQLAEQAKAAGLPIPANTTAQRRGSHGHLLLPIKAKLEKVSVLKENPEPRYTRRFSQRSSEFSPLTQTMHNVRESIMQAPLSAQVAAAKPRVKQTMSAAALSSDHSEPVARSDLPETPQDQMIPELTAFAQGNAPVPVKKCIPPHVRAAEKEAARRKAQSAVRGAMRNALIGIMGNASGNESSETPSLRATAKEFRPVLQFPQPAAQPEAIPVMNEVDIDKFYSAEEWNMLSPQVRKSICTLREYKAGRSSSMTLPPAHHGHFSKPYGEIQRPWNAQQHFTSPSVPDVFKGSPQAGQVLRPHIDPQTQAINWTMRDVSGHEVPVNFGRAAPPAPISPHTPVISATSNDSSPRYHTSGSGAHWTIGPADRHRSVYGWTGGDGKEIKFIGHGANAERDPNSNAKLQYHNKGKAKMGSGPRMINGEDEHDGSPGQPLAPRSRRQWAERMGMPMMPCNEINIEAAFEHVPGPDSNGLFGYCPDCSVTRH